MTNGAEVRRPRRRRRLDLSSVLGRLAPSIHPTSLARVPRNFAQQLPGRQHFVGYIDCRL